MDEHRDKRNWKYTMLGNFRIVCLISSPRPSAWMGLFVRPHWIWLPLKIIKYDASLYGILPITSTCFLFLCLLVCTLSSQLSLKPIQFIFVIGLSSYAVYRVQNRNRISCYRRRVHLICILVFEIDDVRQCIAVVCGVLAHRYLTKIIAVLKILCVYVCVFVCVCVTVDRKTSSNGSLTTHLLLQVNKPITLATHYKCYI